MSRKPWIRRATLSFVVASVVTLGLAGTVAAHECFNDSRSARGNEQAAAGNGWSRVSEIILAFIIPGELGLPQLTEEQYEEALALVAEQKASGDFATIYAQDVVVLDHATAMGGRGAHGSSKSDDGHAIEHITADFSEVDALLNHLVGIYFAVAS
ncbi:MAG: hypothetical protein LC798_09585 [Chloroflexi bacterium]|nr:hypothetical protein [Chloroflexota bacterium]